MWTGPFSIPKSLSKISCHWSSFIVKWEVVQVCPTLGDPMDYTVHGILQASILEWVAFPFSRGSSQPRDWTEFSCIAGRFFTSWAIKGSPRILEWVAYPVSSRSSWPRNHTGVPCIAGRFFTNWAIREAHHLESPDSIKNYHKLSGLKQYQFIILHFWSSWVQNKSQWVKINILAEPCSF